MKAYQQPLGYRKLYSFEMIRTTNESLNDLKKNLEFCSKTDSEGFEYYLVYVKLKDII